MPPVLSDRSAVVHVGDPIRRHRLPLRRGPVPEPKDPQAARWHRSPRPVAPDLRIFVSPPRVLPPRRGPPPPPPTGCRPRRPPRTGSARVRGRAPRRGTCATGRRARPPRPRHRARAPWRPRSPRPRPSPPPPPPPAARPGPDRAPRPRARPGVPQPPRRTGPHVGRSWRGTRRGGPGRDVVRGQGRPPAGWGCRGNRPVRTVPGRPDSRCTVPGRPDPPCTVPGAPFLRPATGPGE